MQSGAELDLSIIMSSETENAERTEKPMAGRMELAIDSRPVASAFRSGVTLVSNVYGYMHKHARLGGSRACMLPREILDALRLLLRPRWDRSREP